MLSKKDYLIYFSRLFFASVLYGVCSLFLHIWNTYQPFELSFQLQRCQSTISMNQTLDISLWNWLKHFHIVQLLPSFPFLSKSMTQLCHLYIKDNYPLNLNKLIQFIHSILLIYFVYHLIHLSLFHCQLKHIQEKQHYYARLYRQKRKYRR